VKTRKKLIEVALPLDAINAASAREKSIRHGHPSTLHLWWARRPLAAARAVIFAQMVDDPSSWPELFPTEEAQARERDRLFGIIEQLVKWESTTDEEVLELAREEMRKSWRRTCEENRDHPRADELFNPDRLPAFHDPFAGGGALPLEAQRLGMESYASDLNPVAVLINKAMIEIPPKFAGKPPVNPDSRAEIGGGAGWKGAQGLAEDVRYYGLWLRDEAEKRIGHLYPKVKITPELVKERPDLKNYQGRELTVIAWLWARTVRSPNPAFSNFDVPLVSNFMLSTKKGKEAYVEPVVEMGEYRFKVRKGRPKDLEAAKKGTKTGRGANFRCIVSESPIDSRHVKAEGRAGRMGARLMAIVLEGDRERVYVSPSTEHAKIADGAEPEWKPENTLPDDPRNFWTVDYGLRTYGDLFTDRQLVALTTFSDLVAEAREQARRDALAAGLVDDGVPLREGGAGATAYGEAMAVFCSMGVDKAADYNTSLVVWSPTRDQAKSTFARQALPMVWDFAEINTFAGAAGDIAVSMAGIGKALQALPANVGGYAVQADAAIQDLSCGKVVSTDPPYYDNIGYADLSDFFYVWARRSMQRVFPDIFATLAVPKSEELVATPYRHGGKNEAERFFLSGMTAAMHRLSELAHPALNVTIYYAFKQAETKGSEGTASTGWATFLDAVISAGFSVRGTWPMRTERGARSIGMGTNALASSIVLVCRARPANAPLATRRQFVAEARSELAKAVETLQKSNLAPVDLAQAVIGPGMAVYSRYSKVVESDGKRMPVRAALQVINQLVGEKLAEQEGDFDPDTRWALDWFDQHGMEEGPYGVAESLSTAKDTSVRGMDEAGIIDSGRGKVRLLKREELRSDWDPTGTRRDEQRITVWEVTQHLIRALETEGEVAAADLLRRVGSYGEIARELAYRLYTTCERKKWADEALSYNGLVTSWPELSRLASEEPVTAGQAQGGLDL